MEATENKVLMRMAREALRDKWVLAIGTFAVYGVLVMALGSIKHIGPVISLLISGPFALGVSIFTLSLSRGEEARLEQIFEGFRHYVKALSTHLLAVVFIVLWMLLLIVPGIIAAYSYSLVFFVLADDRSLEPMEVLNRSQQLMMGYKAKLFWLSMRFFGLALLCILTLGIGFLWLVPYASVTMAKFYDDVKARSAAGQAVSAGAGSV